MIGGGDCKMEGVAFYMKNGFGSDAFFDKFACLR
jgi:hypothetical protein